MALYVCKKWKKGHARGQSTKSETFAKKTIVKIVLLVVKTTLHAALLIDS
jgi:hypothetical protein